MPFDMVSDLICRYLCQCQFNLSFDIVHIIYVDVIAVLLFWYTMCQWCVCLLGPTDSPHNVHIVSNTSSSVAVSWLLPNKSAWNGHLRGCVVRYRQLKPAASSFTTVNVTDISRQCIFIDNLQESGEYEVSVSCFNAACLGPFSDSVQFTVNDTVLQSAPVNVTAASVNSTSIVVSFQPPHFTERSDLYYVITATRHAESSRDGRVRRDSKHAVTVRGRLLTDSVQSDYVTGLDKFTEYHVTVYCETDFAAGPASPTVIVHTLDDGMSFTLHAP